MTVSEACKILNIENREDPDQIMKNYLEMWKKNNPINGGSFYLQCKVHAAKEFLMEGYREREKEIMEELGIDKDSLKTREERQQEEEE